MSFEEKLADGKFPTSLPPGVMDVSNHICMETFCCAKPATEKNSHTGMQYFI